MWLAIMSFTLNRVYTEWYRNKGYDFTITSSTAFDHKWISTEESIFDDISAIVDEVFANYLFETERPPAHPDTILRWPVGSVSEC